MTEYKDVQRATGITARVLPMRERSELIYRILQGRLATVLPAAMRAAGIDMWIILCQEDDLDPVYASFLPLDCWCPILQMLVFCDRGAGRGVEGINLSATNTRDLYDWPYKGQVEAEQWPLLRRIVEERDPARIGINIGSVQWAAGGLPHNLYQQLVEHLPARYVDRLTSAEPVVTHWLATLSDDELVVYEHIVGLAKGIIAECYSPRAIVPGRTTLDDLCWYYWQRCLDLGLEVAFKPYFYLTRSDQARAQYGAEDRTVRPGDLLRCDVGIRYLRLNTDHQQSAYVRRPGETDAPTGLQELMRACGRLQDVFMAEFRQGLTGNELLANILERARREDIPNPEVYSHSVGHLLHEPGPLIGLPWEQERCVGRGDVQLQYNEAFAMELRVAGPVAEWGGQMVRMAQEEQVAFTREGCRPVHSRQSALRLI